MTLLMSAVYRVNSSGPRTEPWRMPHVTGKWTVELLFSTTDWFLPSRYERRHSSGVPRKPNDISRRRSRMVWSTVSKVADKSKRDNSANFPFEMAWTRSKKTVKTAVRDGRLTGLPAVT